MAENNIINTTCILHGIPYCYLCRDEYIRKDTEKYNEFKKYLQTGKSQKNFDLAFALHERAQIWFKIAKIKNLQEYLKEIIRESKDSLRRESLQMAYNTAELFPELKELSNRKFPFDWYREIANNSLSDTEKKEFCRDIEKRYEREEREVMRKGNGLSAYKIREMIKDRVEDKEPPQLSNRREFKYKTAKGCLRIIKRYLRNKKIRKGTPVIFEIGC